MKTMELTQKCNEGRISRKENSHREAVVNTRGPDAVSSAFATQIQDNRPVTYNNHLMEKAIERNNLKSALKRVERNKGAPGIDGMAVDKLKPYLKDNWERIKNELLSGAYKPSPVRRVEIPKPDGGVRELGIPTVVDRFIQQAIQQVLTPIFEPTFSQHNYGFRPKRSARQAVKQAQQYIERGKEYVVDIDLEKFFDRVNHDILMSKVFEQVKDDRMLRIIRRYLQSGVMINGCCIATDEGTPQGGPLSPLLANIMLTDLDKELESRGHQFARYADDCNIYVASARAGMRVFESIKQFIEKHLKLKVNIAKSAVDRPWNRKFLGFTFGHREDIIRLALAPKTVAKFKERIRKLTKRTKGISMNQRIEKLNEYIIGWGGYFGIAESLTTFQKLDQWIRRRLRVCAWKQWKTAKNRIRRLVSLGLSKNDARCIAYTRRGCWRASVTPQISKALSIAYWQNQGLESLAERFYKLRVTI